jgi:hypothetical protein
VIELQPVLVGVLPADHGLGALALLQQPRDEGHQRGDRSCEREEVQGPVPTVAIRADDANGNGEILGYVEHCLRFLNLLTLDH